MLWAVRALKCRCAVALAALALLALLPSAAAAHGPLAPVATSYLARVGSQPPGVEARVVDGYLRLWMRVRHGPAVEVLDYRGAPYVRFSAGGEVYVNEHSPMYYLNQPLPQAVPAGLGPHTPPRWQRVATDGEYEWHDGRIGDLSTVALPPGRTYVGRWKIPILLGGRLAFVGGSLWHEGSPSLAWFWAIAVLLACVLAAWRVRRPSLDVGVGRILAVVVMVALAFGGAAHWLHGRPAVSPEGIFVTVALCAFSAVGIARALHTARPYLLCSVAALVSLWVGSQLLPTLAHAYVLAAAPAFATRVAAVVCLGGGTGLLLYAIRFASIGVERPRGAMR